MCSFFAFSIFTSSLTYTCWSYTLIKSCCPCETAAGEEDQDIKEFVKGILYRYSEDFFYSRASEKFDFALEPQPNALHGMFSRCSTHYTQAVAEVKALLYVQPESLFCSSIPSAKSPFSKHLNNWKTYVNAEIPIKGLGFDLMLPPACPN